MRDDMFKVIVERPRRKPWVNPGTGRRYRADEELAGKIGMKQGYERRKWLNENLAPLRRYLESQVNRPWDKVYSELCANIDRRNTVQEHIFAHIENFVELETRLIDGKVFVTNRWPQQTVPLEESRSKLYVHPKTRLLLRIPHRISHAKLHKQNVALAEAALAQKRRVLSEMEQLHCLDGIWYFITLAQMAPGIVIDQPDTGKAGRHYYPKHWDAVRNQQVSRRHGGIHEAASSLYGKWNIYAVSKRQLSSAELKRYKLTNENAGETRRFRLCGQVAAHAFPTANQQPAALNWDSSSFFRRVRSAICGAVAPLRWRFTTSSSCSLRLSHTAFLRRVSRASSSSLCLASAAR